METSIGYLRTVHGDLLAAARSEAGRGAAPNGGGGPKRRRFPTAGFASAAAAIVVVAGIIGAVVRSGGFSAEVSGGDDGATAATGAGGNLQTIRGPAPSPVEVPDLRSTYTFGNDVSAMGGSAGGRAESGPVLSELSRVIRTAELGLVIPSDSFADRFAQVVDVATDNDGFVSTSTSRERRGTVTMRVPADNYTQTLQDLRALGDVEVQTLQGRDVTAEYVDLRARMRIAKSRREVLLRLMDRATSIEQTIRVQNALDETQLRIEQVQGQLRLLDDQTSLATITVDLREEGVAAEVEAASIPNAFDRAGAGFVGVIAAIIIGLGYLLPLVAIGLVIWFVVVQVRRRAQPKG